MHVLPREEASDEHFSPIAPQRVEARRCPRLRNDGLQAQRRALPEMREEGLNEKAYGLHNRPHRADAPDR
jgi:hypothetical protein